MQTVDAWSAPPATTTRRPRPPLWARMSVVTGNLVQLAGLALGAALLYAAAHSALASGLRVALMLVGWFCLCVCCHASAHWAVGRLVGIRFQGYGLRGTDHPEDYPPPVRQLMSVLPFFTALTQKESMQGARPWAKALMFAAGETSTALWSIGAGWYAWRSGIPGGWWLFAIMVVFNLVSTVVTTVVPRGDYAKARRALRPAPREPSR